MNRRQYNRLSLEQVETWLAACAEHVRGEPAKFIEGLQRYYAEHKFLTIGQASALQKFYLKLSPGRRRGPG